MYRIIDRHKTPLTKEMIDNLFFELNKALRKKMRKYPSGYKATLYVVGGASVVTRLQSRESTEDVDAMWDVGATMRDCINEVGDKFNLGHTWCNCDFKTTKSYTNAIVTQSTIYVEFDRLIVRMVNLDLLLAMKLVAYRIHKPSDMQDCQVIVSKLRESGINVNTQYLTNLIVHYYGSLDIISEDSKHFIGVK